MISVKAYHNKEQNRRLRQLFSGKWAIQVRNPGMSRGWESFGGRGGIVLRSDAGMRIVEPMAHPGRNLALLCLPHADSSVATGLASRGTL